MADRSVERLVLGSASPRRAALLKLLGVDFDVHSVDLDEQALLDDGADATTSVARIASAKFEAFSSIGIGEGDRRLLTADTLVACEGVVMGKPTSADDGAKMLRQMSDRTLDISTAVCVGTIGMAPISQLVTTNVRLRALTTEDILAYVSTGSGLDKAAGLALQGEARSFISYVDGCWSNVMGLPLCAVATALALAPPNDTQPQRCHPDLCGDWTIEGYGV